MTEYIHVSDAIFRRDQPDAISGELIYDEVDGVNGQRIIGLLETVDGLRAEITAERQASEREAADGLEFRNHIAALLPESWYTALPVEDRIRLLVEQWRKLHASHVELTAERDALRAQFHTQAEQRDFVGKLVDNMPHAQIAAEFEEFKAEVADALAALRAEFEADAPEHNWTSEQKEMQRDSDKNVARVNATMTALGLAPKEKQ